VSSKGRLRSRVKIEGMEALQRKLGALPEAVKNPVLREAVIEAAEPVRADAAARAPRRTGELADHMLAVPMEGEADRAAVRIGPNATAWYGVFQEKGTKKHAAQPFLRPALDSKRRQAVNLVRKRLRAALEREATKG
jgi:HK97 gp10 family phage protein